MNDAAKNEEWFVAGSQMPFSSLGQQREDSPREGVGKRLPRDPSQVSKNQRLKTQPRERAGSPRPRTARRSGGRWPPAAPAPPAPAPSAPAAPPSLPRSPRRPPPAAPSAAPPSPRQCPPLDRRSRGPPPPARPPSSPPPQSQSARSCPEENAPNTLVRASRGHSPDEGSGAGCAHHMVWIPTAASDMSSFSRPAPTNPRQSRRSSGPATST